MLSDKILSVSPWVEVFVKTLYWRSAWVNKILAKYARLRSKSIDVSDLLYSEISFDNIIDQLKLLGVSANGIMVVHSSGSALNQTGLSPTQMCEKLIDFIGSHGTLAMPAIPICRGEPKGIERLNDEICSQRLTYDVRKSPPWTGSLPKALMGFLGAVRSRHPLNSMVAVGPRAQEMMAHNIEGERPLACGLGSSWKYCSDNNATIVCLGVDMAHSLTMIHVAEDSWADQWPIKSWYRDRLFHVKDGEFEVDLTVRERRPHWAINYCERTLKKDLVAHGLIKTAHVGRLRIETCESANLIEFLNSRKPSAYPYWIPFWNRGKS